MNFYLNFGYLEAIGVAMFLVLYGLYGWLSYRRAKILNLPLRKYFWLKLIFRLVYFNFFILALLGPTIGEEKQQVKVQGKDIMFVVDVSDSMLAQDVLPSRLEKVKFELQNLLQNPLQARMGMVVFAQEAYQFCPLTKDYSLLQSVFIPALSTQMMKNPSTQIYNAIELALQSLLNESQDQIHKRAKILVLFTDGEDWGENIITLAQTIKRKGVHLLVVGVGSEQGSPILTATGFKKNDKGEKVISKLNRNYLLNFVSQAEGKYFEISQEGQTLRNDMDKVRTTLEEIQGILQDKREISLEANKYYYPLILAFVMLCLDMVVTTRIIKLPN
ncbi:MAG: VWA domain-containing protein [Raineya sp.]|nr:VWA domain-containing protein [Raineya sp.]